MTATVYGLLAFIIAQPAERETDHNSWNSCAVGDYAREVHGHEIAQPVRYDFSPVWNDPVLKALMLDSGSVDEDTIERYGCREMPGWTVMDRLCDMDANPLTYGELRHWLGDDLYVQPGTPLHPDEDPIVHQVMLTGRLPG